MVVSPEEFRLYVNASPNDEMDSLHGDLIQGAQEAVESYLGYPIESAAYNRSYDGTGLDKIYLDVRPVTELTELEISGEDQDISGVSIIENMLISRDFTFPRGTRNIRISFTGGYASGEVPKLIKATVLRIAGILWTESGGNVGITSKTFDGGGSRAFLNTRFDKYLHVLDKYRILWVG